MSHGSIELALRALRNRHLRGVIGIILFGSAARCGGDELSDIDIAIFWNRELSDYERISVDDVDVELLYHPVRYLREAFSGGVRGRRDTWMRVCFWLNLLRDGVILRDEGGILNDYRERALKWRWRRGELDKTLRGVEADLRMAERLLNEGRTLRAILCLRDALNLLTVHKMMSRGEVPSYRPKELYRAVRLIGEEYLEIYREAMGLEGEIDVEEIITLCHGINSRFRAWSPTVERALREVFKAAAKGDVEMTLLSARHYALKAMREALERHDMRPKLEYFYSDSHLRLLDEARGVEDGILQRYVGLQGLGGVPSPRMVREKISIISGCHL